MSSIGVNSTWNEIAIQILKKISIFEFLNAGNHFGNVHLH